MSNSIIKSQSAGLTVAFILSGLLIFVAYAAVLHRKADPTQEIDLKVYYAASKALAENRNPYDNAVLIDISHRADPAGDPAGVPGEYVSNVPASLIAFIPFSALPWRVFCLLFVLGVAFSIPTVILLSAKAFGYRLTAAQLAGMSLLGALFAPTWRAAAVGQITPFVLVAMLGGLLAMQRGRPWVLGATLLASLAKVTCCVPFYLYLFVRGDRRTRLAILAAALIFAAVNVAEIRHIGQTAFVRDYAANLDQLFSPGWVNSAVQPWSLRADLEPIVAAFAPDRIERPLALAADVLCAVPLLILLGRRKASVAAETTGVLILTLLITYHRAYDALMAMPLLVMACVGGEESRCARPLRVAALIAAAVMLGNHNVFHALLRDSSGRIEALGRSIAVLALYAATIAPAMAARNGVGHALPDRQLATPKLPPSTRR